MAHDFRKREEEEELVKRFEESLKKNSVDFFALEQYETIIDHYLDRTKYKKALSAVEAAIEQYPFSTELMPLKAQILSNLERYDEALEILERARNLNPADIDIYLSIGSVLSLMGKHSEAIETYEQALAFADEGEDELYYNIGLAYQSIEEYEGH
jgi:tetratricopeptide (TPR) repeat protein